MLYALAENECNYRGLVGLLTIRSNGRRKLRAAAELKR